MTRTYCDLCEKEITAENAVRGGRCGSRLGATLEGRNGRKLSVEIITGLDGVSNVGHFCAPCVIDALLKLDPRKCTR